MLLKLVNGYSRKYVDNSAFVFLFSLSLEEEVVTIDKNSFLELDLLVTWD